MKFRGSRHIPFDPEGEAKALEATALVLVKAAARGPLNRRLRRVQAAFNDRILRRAYEKAERAAEERRRRPELARFGARVAAADAVWRDEQWAPTEEGGE